MRKQLGLVLAAILGVLMMGGDVLGQVVIFTNPITGTDPGLINPYTTGQVISSNLTVTGIGRGIGVTGNAAANRYNANSWNTVALDPTAYFTWGLTPASGYAIDVSSFVYTGQVSDASINSFAFRSSADLFSANIGTPTSTGATINTSSSAHQNIIAAIEFRLYAWGASAATNTFSVNDFTYSGLVSNRWSGATSSSLSDGGNFVSLASPQPQNGIQFEGALNTNVVVDSALSVQGIRFASGASAFTVGGSFTLVIDDAGGIANYSSNVQTINANLSINASQTINASTANIDLGGVVSSNGTFGITKTGSSTLTLSGNNTYTGNTTVSAGSLLVNGQSSSNSGTGTGTVTVNSGGTLGGTGRISGITTVNSNATIRAGDATGLGDPLNFQTSLTIASGATLSTRIADAAGSSNRIEVASGTLSISSTANIHINGTGATFDPTQTYTYLVAQRSGQDLSGLSITDQARFTTSGFDASGFAFKLTGSAAGDVILTFTPVPEPGTLLALGAAGLGLLGAYRRYRSPAVGVDTVA